MDTRERQLRGHGFSLIELVLVLAIIGVLAAIAMPRFVNSIARYRVDAAAKRIATDLNFAASEAKTTSKTVVVRFNPLAASYELVGVARLDNRPGSYIVTLVDDPYDCRLVSASFGGAQQVTFNLFGTPSQSGKIVVAAGPISRTITLAAPGGKVTVE